MNKERNSERCSVLCYDAVRYLTTLSGCGRWLPRRGPFLFPLLLLTADYNNMKQQTEKPETEIAILEGDGMEREKHSFGYLYERIGSYLTKWAGATFAAFLILFCALLIYARSAVSERALLRAEARAFQFAMAADPYARTADGTEESLTRLSEIAASLGDGGAFRLLVLDREGAVLTQGSRENDPPEGYPALAAAAAQSGHSTLKSGGGTVSSAVRLSNGWYAVCRQSAAGTAGWAVLCIMCALAGILFVLSMLNIVFHLAVPVYVAAERRGGFVQVPLTNGPGIPSGHRRSRTRAKFFSVTGADGPVADLAERTETPPRPEREEQAAPAAGSAEPVPDDVLLNKEAVPSAEQTVSKRPAKPETDPAKGNGPAPTGPEAAEPERTEGPGADEPEDPTRPLADGAAMLSFYAQVAKAAQNMDCDVLSEAFERMDGYRLPAAEAKLYAELRGAFDIFEYGMILNMLEENGKIGPS